MSIFKFNYVPPEELTTGAVILADGPASFSVKDVRYTDKDGEPLKSGNGDPKVTVVLNVKDSNGMEGTIYENLTPKTNWKIHGLLKGVGKKHLYTEEGVDFALIKGCSGKCILKTESRPGYNDRTTIAQYEDHFTYADPVKFSSNEKVTPGPEFDDSIPF